MILRRTKRDPSAALNELTRDLSRIRADLDNVRSAFTVRGREALREAGERVGDSTRRAGQGAGEYVREHPGMSSGIAVGIIGLLALLLYATMRR
ncbi:MAG: hypothetical protein ACODAQ_09900 [Phycisphaeraceae bacterium]